MGKTAFVLSMAKNMAVDRRIPVAVFDLEMSNVQLVNRMMMNVCEIEGDKIKTGKMSKNDWVQSVLVVMPAVLLLTYVQARVFLV